jgi:uncharacterized protein (TIGR02145 family)
MKKWLIFASIVLALLPLDIYSQNSIPVQSQKKVALVIGNGSYISSELANPENDSRAIANILQKLGFVVYKYENLTQGQMKKAIDEFGAKLKYNDVALFYYAGHGIQSNGYNYLIPVDAQLITEKQVEYDCVQADRILALMEGSDTKVNILILDACRNNPFERSWTRSASGKGLAFMNAPKGTLIAYATSPGSTASDGGGKNGLYTSAILESIQIPNLTILQMFQQVRSIVSQKSNDKQTPWESTSLTGDFYFNTGEISSSYNQNSLENNDTNNIRDSSSEMEVIDTRDNQKYKTININNQLWMAENLRTTKLNDGTDLPCITDKNKWNSVDNIAMCWYNEDSKTYKGNYGALYNWYTVTTNKLCPIGWHIPSDKEWSDMAKSLGTSKINSFVGHFGGLRANNGTYSNLDNVACWWSSSEKNKQKAIFRMIRKDDNEIYKGDYFKTNGYSVRCLKDRM